MRTLVDAFLEQVQNHGDAVAIVERDPHGEYISYTWNQLAQQTAARVGHLAKQLAFAPRASDCISVQHHNRVADVCTSLAVMTLGAIEVAIDGRLDEAAICDICSRVDGLHLSSDWDQDLSTPIPAPTTSVAILQAVHQTIDERSPALVLWTSGTLGQPKGVVLSHKNLLGNAMAKRQAVPETANDTRLTTLSLAHGYARTCDMGTWLLSGSRLVLSLGLSGWETIGCHFPPTLANVVPSIACRLLEQDALGSLSRLKILGCGGAPLSRLAFEAFRERGVTIIQGYGLTEASPVVSSATPENATPGLVGTPVQGCEFEIREKRLFIRGPHVMLGYWNDEKSTQARIDENGWLDTGDLAEIDSISGQLRILGRADDVIVLPTGNKIHPREVESVVEELPGVHLAVLVHHDNALELWIDAAPSHDHAAVIAKARVRLTQFPKRFRPERVNCFVPPLSMEAGELTHKGTSRRKQILERRFDIYAGS